jgi:hypothetical protein
MQSIDSDVMIHVDATLSGAEMAAIADSLYDNACVRGACVSESAPHLIMVCYDSDCTQARSLLSQIRDRGIRAELVGL